MEKDEFGEWLRTSDVAAELGVSVRTVMRWATKNKIKIRSDFRGVQRWSPADVEQVLQDLGKRPPPASEDELNEPSEAKPVSMETILGAAAQLVSAAHAHVEKMHGLIVKPLELIAKRQEEMMQYSAARIRELEEGRDKMIASYERRHSQELERELMVADQAATQRRKDAAMKLLASRIPSLLDMLTGTETPGLKLIKSLDLETLTGIRDADILTPEQRALLDAELATREPDTPESLEP